MKSLPSHWLAGLAAFAFIPALSLLAADESFYLGTYTKPGGSQGIYHFSLNTETGAVTGGELAATTANPTFLAIRPDGKYLYAANEVSQGAASAFAIKANGGLEFLNRQSVRGDGPAHIWADAAGKNVLFANYGSGSVGVLPIKADGSLAEVAGYDQHTGSSVDPNRQKEPHAHSIYTDAADRFAYVCDLGVDKVYIYKYDSAKGGLAASEPAFATVPPGSGPRHLAFHPKGYAYVINEMKNTISAFKYNAAKGTLEPLQNISTLPADFNGNSSTAEIFIHPNGKFLYGSNRGHDSLALFTIDQASGQLTAAGHTKTGGKGPRHFAIDPTGKFLIAENQQTDDFFVFRIDEATGALTQVGDAYKVGAPVCIVFAPPAK